MPVFQCRTVRPQVSSWDAVEADSPEEAANDFHFQNDERGVRHIVREENRQYVVTFSCVEVEGYGELVARTFKYPIWRKGGVPNARSRYKTLEDIAKALDWCGDPESLLGSGWLHEEPDPH